MYHLPLGPHEDEIDIYSRLEPGSISGLPTLRRDRKREFVTG